MTEKLQSLLRKLIQFEGVDEGSSDDQKEDVSSVLQELVNELKDEQCRNALSVEDVKRLCKLLEAFVILPKEGASAKSVKSLDGSLCTESLRCLRNACVQNEGNQNQIGQSGTIKCIKSLVTSLCSSEADTDESSRTMVRCAVQLAGNLVSGNANTRMLVWKDLFPQSFISVLSYNDTKASIYCCMVLNECLADDLLVQQLIKQPEGHHIIEAVLRLCEEETQHDFSLQIMQKLLTTSDFMLSTYDSLPTTAKIIVLDILAAVLSQSEGPSHTTTQQAPVPNDACCRGVPVFTVAYLAEQFEELAKGVMTLITEEQSRTSAEEMTPVLTLRLLTVLGIAASNHEAYRRLQDRESLLQTALELLERARLSGTHEQVPVSPPQPVNQDGSNSSPVYGLKRDLVRLIGNMCYRHRANQDKVRELQGIPLILEHCNVDDQNPFISQWAILTIRNLCEDNQDNQAFIAGMTTQGAAPSPDFLREMGVEVEMRDGIPYVKTTSKKE